MQLSFSEQANNLKRHFTKDVGGQESHKKRLNITIIRAMQVKITIRYNYPATKTTKIRRADLTRY